MATVKVKVIRGVYIRGKAYAEGAVVDIPGDDYGELFTAGCVVKHVESAPKADATVSLGGTTAASKAGDAKAGK